MKLSVPSASLGVVLALALPTSATAQTSKCVTPAQVSALAVAMFPGAVSKFAGHCASVLPEGTALRVSGANAESQYREAALAARPKAYEAIQIIAGEKLPQDLSLDAVFPFVQALLYSEIDKAQPAKTCVAANNIWSAFKALPFENWGLLLAATLSADQTANPKDNLDKEGTPNLITADIPICPYIAMEN